MFVNQLEQAGIEFYYNTKLVGVKSDKNGQVEAIECLKGKTNRFLFETYFVILGTGVSPTTDFLKDSGLKLNKHGAIVCNKYLQTNIADVYAAGDLVEYPYLQTGAQIATEHWVAA
jgi:NADPH-dependent 2,4-dienoyl-CoA reductase/sulfur reductase-like enzyme